MKKIFSFISLLALLSACEINQKDIKPEDAFIKIYNHPDDYLAYYPESVIQTSDAGFLILCGTKSDTAIVEYPLATIIKTNNLGEVLNTVETEWLAPAPDLINLNGEVAFAAMNSLNEGYIIFINPSSGEISSTQGLGITMPLKVYKGEAEQLIVLGYNYIDWTSTISVYNSSIQATNTTAIEVKNDLISMVQSHMNKSGESVPFFIGEYESGFYVNCLGNYTIRASFFDQNGNIKDGNLYVFQEKDALSSLLNKTGSTFAMTYYNGTNNYLIYGAEVDINAKENIGNLEAERLFEISPRTKVISKKFELNGAEYMIIASSTNSNSIIIYQYLMETSETTENSLVHTELIDFADKIDIVSLTQDPNDFGLIILAKLYLTGKHLRTVLIKVPADKFYPNE